jgi:hypothetical protein
VSPSNDGVRGPSLTRYRLKQLEEDNTKIWEELKAIREERTKDLRESVKLMRGIFVSVGITLLATLVNLFYHNPSIK